MKKNKNESSSNQRSTKTKEAEAVGSDEVDQLLQAAQDELLLKLSIDSHMSRVAPDYLDPDLHRRFQALKSRPAKTSSSSSSSKSTAVVPSTTQQPTEKVAVNEDDLLARFAALKNTSSSSASSPGVVDLMGPAEFDENDEVERLVQWAKDAARLDPSPPSDDDDDDDDYLDDEDDDYETDDREEHKVVARGKGRSK